MPKDLVGIDESGFEHRVFLDTDSSLAANSDEKVASQKAVKQYVSDNAGGAVPVKATGAELVTGTDDAKFATAKALADALVQRGVKRYVALISQSTTDAPVATVLENTLGAPVVWTRDNVGIYIGTLAAAFTVNKTVCAAPNPFAVNSDFTFGQLTRIDANSVRLITKSDGITSADEELLDTLIQISVYP